MKNTDSIWVKMFLGFGIITVISGIYLIFREDYIGGISGSIVGIGLIWLNRKQAKEKSSE